MNFHVDQEICLHGLLTLMFSTRLEGMAHTIERFGQITKWYPTHNHSFICIRMFLCVHLIIYLTSYTRKYSLLLSPTSTL